MICATSQRLYLLTPSIPVFRLSHDRRAFDDYPDLHAWKCSFVLFCSNGPKCRHTGLKGHVQYSELRVSGRWKQKHIFVDSTHTYFGLTWFWVDQVAHGSLCCPSRKVGLVIPFPCYGFAQMDRIGCAPVCPVGMPACSPQGGRQCPQWGRPHCPNYPQPV